MKDAVYRIYILSKESLIIRDLPDIPMVKRCTEICEKYHQPYMVMVYDTDDKHWYYTGEYMDRGTVQDSIGKVPFDYDNKYMKEATG